MTGSSTRSELGRFELVARDLVRSPADLFVLDRATVASLDRMALKQKLDDIGIAAHAG